jgi:putative endonuclease
MEPNNQTTREKGYIGEDIAGKYLEENGYTIVKRNFTFGRVGEVDIIAEKNSKLVFVEVKYRTSDKYGDPLFAINPRKVQSMRKTAEGYLYVNKITNREIRFDVITIDVRDRSVPPKLNHIEQAIW